MFKIAMEDVWPHIYSLKPGFLSRNPHFNFITIHYFWIMGSTIVGSICIYPGGNIAYIDALFFGSGAATQSGLNTVDVNLLTTWQQLVIYILSMICNPIVIHTFVVFLRLYWFEKRFQNVVREARRLRRSTGRTLSKPKSDERDVGAEERGVNGRNIVVVRGSARRQGPDDSTDSVDKTQIQETKPELASSDSSADTAIEEKDEPPVTPTTIQFADRVKRSDGLPDKELRLPAQRDPQEYIAFVENQRKADEGEILRIPNPRDADAGAAPLTLTPCMKRRQSHANSTYSQESPGGFADGRNEIPDTEMGPQEAIKRRVTIAEPANPRAHHRTDDAKEDFHNAAAAAFSPYRFPRPVWLGGEKKQDGESVLHRARSNLKSALSSEKAEGSTYLSWEPTIGRNSQFVNLSESQREELGGIEYRSLKSLALILVCYFWGFSILAVICLVPWILRSDNYGKIVESDGQGRVWWGIFTANTAFNDLGFTLTPDSMISFASAVWPLLAMSFLIVIGNTGFPIMLRFTIWVTSLWVPTGSGIWEELRFLLDHPRRCFTLLFPARATWWLFLILVILNATDLLFYIILDLGKTVVTALPLHIRFLDGWFQAVSTRTAGTAVVNISDLHPAIQVSYLIMMYISALPIAISVRRTNVYEERSLGIWGGGDEDMEQEGQPSYVGAHLRRQLSFDLWFIFLGFFVIAIAEGGPLGSGDPGFNMFSVLFEIVSAYGTVGLSLGYPGINASFSAKFGVIGKLVIIAMQIRGRHRGLPYELDRAILLPSENKQREGDEDHTPSDDSPQLQMEMSKAKTMDKQHSNVLSTLLHPGPAMPQRPRRRTSAVSHYSTGTTPAGMTPAGMTPAVGATGTPAGMGPAHTPAGLGVSTMRSGAMLAPMGPEEAHEARRRRSIASERSNGANHATEDTKEERRKSGVSI